MRKLLLLPSVLMLNACFAGSWDFSSPAQPQQWSVNAEDAMSISDAAQLKAWWKNFDDPTLNALVDLALSDSPDRLMAEARVLEARGLRRSAMSSLFPQIGASATTGRQDTGVGGTDNFYDAGFDASFEVDVFGQNRKAYSAADSDLEAAEAQYHHVSLTLIAEVVRSYIDFRAAQSQYSLSQKNLETQEKTLSLISDLNRLGEAPRLDVERAVSLVSTTRAALPEYKRQEDNARLRLSVLAGVLPETIVPMLSSEADIPVSDIAPLLMAPSQVLALRPDIRAANANLAAQTTLSESATAAFFPSFNLSGFFGIADSALVSSATVWNVAAGAAVALLDFGKIEGRIDASRAREKQAYEQYRKTVLEAVAEVETALTDYAHINEQHVSLQKAYDASEQALDLSQQLYKEGEVSFLDVLDAQRSVNSAESALIAAKAAKSESLTRLYKSLGVYQ